MRGAWRVRLEEPSFGAALEPVLAGLAHGEDPPAAEVVKRSRAREVLRLPLADGGACYLKHDRVRRGPWRRAPARREYANLRRLRRAGFAAVEPLALAERRGRGGRDVWLVTRALANAVPLSAHLRQGDPVRAHALLTQAAALARRLHEARLWHRDLHPGNLLVQGDALHLVDVQKLRALPFPPPLALRARDLVGLVSDGRPEPRVPSRLVAEAYVRALPNGPDLEAFHTRLKRAVARAARVRLRSRGRRCMTDSTGFRRERRGTLCVLRRADVTTGAALAAAEQLGDAADRQLRSFVGGPPQGPAADPFGRGQGAPESGAPAEAPAVLRRFGGGLALRDPPALAHPGCRAWRQAHALLLRGADTPAPLALVEKLRFGFVSHSVLLTRCADDALDFGVALAGAPGRARAAGVELAHWHARGIEAARLELRFRIDVNRLVAARPERARLHDSLSPSAAERDLARIVAPLGPVERRALVEAYRETAAR